MSRWRIVVQCAALVSAILLVGGYVYVSSRGHGLALAASH